MYKLICSFTLLTALFCTASAHNDVDNLVKLAEFYSKDTNLFAKDFEKSANALRTPKLSKMVDTLIMVSKADKRLLTPDYLSRPSNDDLKRWYVLREIHYNNGSEKPRPNSQVAREVLAKDIDERWLLDNYYYRIRSGIAMLFNKANLSDTNIDFNKLGLKSDSEKATLYFALASSMTDRFRVLFMVKNYDKLIEFSSKMPTFNGKPYYEYKSFSFDDFQWIGYEKTESYKERHLKGLYNALLGHYFTLVTKGKKKQAKKIFNNSILSEPDLFKYSGMEKNLRSFYERTKE